MQFSITPDAVMRSKGRFDNVKNGQDETEDPADIPMEEIRDFLLGLGDAPDFQELMDALGDGIYDYIIDKINHMSDEELLV